VGKSGDLSIALTEKVGAIATMEDGGDWVELLKSGMYFNYIVFMGL
jgi:hypothetical protein